jgi:fatty acid desaturase
MDDDYSGSFNRMRTNAVNGQGVAMSDFIGTLSPRFWIVYRDISVGYLLIAATVTAAAVAERSGLPAIAVALATSISIGYWIAYLQLFIHEGAHWNLAKKRATNDLLANLVICWWTGQEIDSYRKVHLQHHRSLGDVDDSERTYFLPLNPAFILKGISGALVLAVFATRKSVATTTNRRQGGSAANGARKRRLMLIAGVLAHTVIVGALAYLGLWGTALGWIIGVGCLFPFFGALRQLLEHRSENARPEVDYRTVAHGAYTRMFGTGWVDSTFGAAGFNRHLLHHWSPAISYTRLGDLERFLLDTPVKSIIDARRTTYFQAFRSLFHAH